MITLKRPVVAIKTVSIQDKFVKGLKISGFSELHFTNAPAGMKTYMYVYINTLYDEDVLILSKTAWLQQPPLIINILMSNSPRCILPRGISFQANSTRQGVAGVGSCCCLATLKKRYISVPSFF